MVMFVDRHQKPHCQKYRCCDDIQVLSQIMTIMMENDRQHFISTTTICGYGNLRVVTVDAYIWRWTVTISYFGESQKMSPKEPLSPKIDRHHSIWMSWHDGIEPPTSCF